MKNFAVLLLLAFLGFRSQAFALSASDQEARAATLHFLSLIDAGHYEQAYQEMPPRIHRGSLEANFVRYMKGRREPLGRPISRAFWKVNAFHQLVTAPDGNYQSLSFKTSFTRKKQAVEQVTVTHETGRWQVSGVHFY